MKKKLFSTLLLALATLAMHASDSTTVRRTVYFDTDISQLSDSARSGLDQLAAGLRDAGEYSIYIYGAADVDGGDQYNQKLSERRAQTVRDYLLARNLKARECASRGLGRQGDQATKAGNRRVDVEVRLTRYGSMDELTDALSAGTDQYFTIDPAKAQEIRCKDGTKIEIPAGAFRGADGRPIAGAVRINVREALGMAQYLTQDLSAVSDGRMLESRGMIYVSATADGRPVTLGSEMTVALPARDSRSDMKLFYGQRGGDKTMNWSVTGQKFEKPDPTVPIKLDMDALKRAEIRERVYPNLPKMEEIKMPVAPSNPRKPIQAKKPVEGQGLYHASKSEKLFHPKYVAEKNKELYDQAVKRYDEYVAKEAEYQEKLKGMPLAQKKYNEDMAAFLKEGKRRLAVAQEYFRALYAYNASGAINAKLRELEALPVTNKTNFYVLTEDHENEPREQKESLRAILGDAYFRYYRFEEMGSSVSSIFINDSKEGAYRYRKQNYEAVYDSIYQAHHITDTLRSMQARLIQKCADMGLLSAQKLDGYVASVNQLGWINCDRFIETAPSQLADVRVNEANDAKVYMVFHDINSCLPLYKNGEAYVSSKVPKGRQVSIVSIRLDNGKPQIAVAKINTSRRDPVQLSYKTCTLDEMRAQFSAVGS